MFSYFTINFLYVTKKLIYKYLFFFEFKFKKRSSLITNTCICFYLPMCCSSSTIVSKKQKLKICVAQSNINSEQRDKPYVCVDIFGSVRLLYPLSITRPYTVDKEGRSIAFGQPAIRFVHCALLKYRDLDEIQINTLQEFK